MNDGIKIDILGSVALMIGDLARALFGFIDVLVIQNFHLWGWVLIFATVLGAIHNVGARIAQWIRKRRHGRTAP